MPGWTRLSQIDRPRVTSLLARVCRTSARPRRAARDRPARSRSRAAPGRASTTAVSSSATRVAQSQLPGREPLLEARQHAPPVGRRQRPALGDGRLAAGAASARSDGASTSGASTGRKTTTSRRSRPQPGDDPGERRAHRAAVVERAGTAARRPSASLPTAIRSSHASPSTRHARSASVSPPSRASAFGEPNRLLAPPTSRTPVSPDDPPRLGVDVRRSRRGRSRRA